MKDEHLVLFVALLAIAFVSLIAFTPFLNKSFTGHAVSDKGSSVSFSVQAAGTLYAGQGPLMQLWVRQKDTSNWKRLTQWHVQGEGYHTYAYIGKLSNGSYELAIVYPNDASGSGQDRDLFLNSIKINENVFFLTDTSYVFDQGVGRNALNDKNTAEIKHGILRENGALRNLFFSV